MESSTHKRSCISIPLPDLSCFEEESTHRTTINTTHLKQKRLIPNISTLISNREINGITTRLLRGTGKGMAFRPFLQYEPKLSTYDTDGLPAVAKFSKVVSWPILLAVGVEDGNLHIFSISGDDINDSIHHIWKAHKDSIFDLSWFNGDNNKLVTAASDYSLRVWDVEKRILRYQCIGHASSVKSVAVHHHDSIVFASGGRDGNAIIWDLRCAGYKKGVNKISTQKPYKKLSNIHCRSPSNGNNKRRRRTKRVPPTIVPQVTSVSWFPDDIILITGGDLDGQIKLWDTRYARKGPLVTLPQYPISARRYGVTSVDVNISGTEFLVSSMDNHIYRYSCLDPTKGEIALHSVNIDSFYVRATYSRCGTYIMCGSSKKKVYLWNVEEGKEKRTNRKELSNYCFNEKNEKVNGKEGIKNRRETSKPFVVMRGHLGEVHTVDMAPGTYEKIVSCSEDGTVKLWCTKEIYGNNNNRRRIGRGETIGNNLGLEGTSLEREDMWHGAQESPSPSPVITRRPSFAIPQAGRRGSDSHKREARQLSLLQYFQKEV